MTVCVQITASTCSQSKLVTGNAIELGLQMFLKATSSGQMEKNLFPRESHQRRSRGKKRENMNRRGYEILSLTARTVVWLAHDLVKGKICREFSNYADN